MTRLLVGLPLLGALLLSLFLSLIRLDPPLVSAAPALSSVAVTERVAGGGNITIKVTLTGRAGASTRVAVSSSNRAALPTASSITVASGRSTASVTLPSGRVAGSTTVTVTARLGGVTKTDRATILPPALASVSLPASVGGGLTAEGTVRLTSPAPSGGILVTLKANRPSRMTLPASVRVASGRTTARFTVTAVGEADASVTVTGRLGVAKTDVIAVTALRVRIDLPARVFADVPVVGRVVLNGTAPTGGAAIPVDLTATLPMTVAPPASVSILPGVSGASFGFTAPVVAPSDLNGLTAQVRGRTGPGATAFRQLDIETNLRSVTVAPARRGASTTGTIRLHQAYPAAVNVALMLSDPTIATVPVRVRMLAGQTTATFDVRLDANGVSTLTATARSSRATRQIEVGIVGGFAGDAARVYAGFTTTVRLEIRPLPYSVTLDLRSSDASLVAFTSPTVTIPVGDDGTVDLPIQVKELGVVRLSASYDGVALSQTVAVEHVVRRIDLLDPPALGAVDARLTMDLTRSGAYTVALHSNSAAASVPATVTVPAGQAEVPFAITINALGSADITATYGGVTRTLTVSTGIYVQDVTVQGAYVGAEATGVVTLSGDVSAATVVELFAEDSGLVVVPATVTVPAGADQAVFPITGVALGTTTVSARISGYDRSATVTTTGLVASVEAADAMVGLPATGRVTIAVPQAGPVEITLASSDPAFATVPATVTIPAAASSAAFPIATLQTGTPLITASFGGVPATASLSIVPLFNGIGSGPAHFAGETETATLGISLPAPGDLMVSLSSSDPSVSTVPATVTVLEGEQAVAIPVTNVAAGETVLTATLNGQSATIDWIVGEPSLASVAVSAVYAGLPATGTITLTRSAAGPVVVSLQEWSGDLLALPSSVTVMAGRSTAEFAFTARRAGETDIRATVAGEPYRAVAVTVVQILDDLTVSDAYVGEPATGALALVAPAPLAFDVPVQSSHPDVATVPQTLTVPAGSASVEIPITPVGPGNTRITVTFGELVLSTDLTVVQRATLATLSVPPLYAGLPGAGQVTLSANADQSTVVQLTSSDAGVATVPATVTVLAGQAVAPFTVTTVGVGTTTITATLDGVTLAWDATVGSYFQGFDRPILHPLVESQQVTVSFFTAAPAPLTLGVSSDSAIVSVPATVGVGSGAPGVGIPITVTGSGSFTLTVTLNGFAHAETLTVSPLLRDAACVACPVVAGGGTTATVRLNAAPANAFNILLSSDNPAVASVAGSMAVAAGATSGEFAVSAVSPGTATITAAWNGESVSFSVEVVAAPLAATGLSEAIRAGEGDGGHSASKRQVSDRRVGDRRGVDVAPGMHGVRSNFWPVRTAVAVSAQILPSSG